jgi:CRP/FNR family transcriptional regulator
LANKNVISLDKIKVACRDCSLSTLCLPMGLRPEDVDRLDAIVKRSRPLQRGDHLFRTGEHFRNLYVVKTGAVKTFTQTNDGDEQVVGFHLPGEVLGLDAIQDGSHGCNARALETTAICELPFDRLADLSANIPSLQHQMFRLLSREIGHEAEMMTLLGRGTAEERVASFLLSLSERFRRRGFSATDFFLSMSRQEIGSYLGLALETVSRLFTRFQDEGILKVDRKHVQILDIDRLRAMVAHQPHCEPHQAHPSS